MNENIINQLQSMSVYVPPSVVRSAVHNPHQQLGGTWQRFYAATAFVDISGFTPLAEELAKHGIRGAEELTTILNQVFEALINAVESHGGQVVKFGGDALSLIWPCEPEYMHEAVWRAVQAGFAMQVSMARFTTVITSNQEFRLQMKIGISAGELLEVHAGGVFGRWEYVLAGSPMANMSTAEDKAKADEIVLDHLAWQQVKGLEIDKINRADLANKHTYILGKEVTPGFYAVTRLHGAPSPRKLHPPDWSRLNEVVAAKVSSLLRGYIPGAISSILESGHKSMLAELKPMTICFLGFDGIDYDNDLEAGSRLVNFMRDAQEMIYHYEGSVNKLAVGDKGSVLLVLFGAPPFFHEDDEIRGVACALSLLKVSARHQLQPRIGLATGTVFAGPLGGPQRQEYSVISDTVNLAARLMQKAPPGQIWLDSSIRNKANRFFEYDDLGPISLKGKAEQVNIFRVLGEKDQDQEELIMDYLLSAQELTGRDKELAIVDKLADEVWAGHGQILFLNGEAGVGKSRLLAEIVKRWMMRGGVSHGGDCVSYGQQTPYFPWRGILASIAGLSPRLPAKERLVRLERTLLNLEPPSSQIKDGVAISANEYWHERLPLLADILGLTAEETELTRNLAQDLRRDNVFSTIRAIVLQEAQQRPTLIVVEDTHWSDQLSMELVAHLATDIAHYPAFIVLAHRPLGDPLPLVYQRLNALPYANVIQVNELSPEAGLKLVKNKLGVKELPQPLIDLILKKGQGNPFFIEELVNSLLSMGVIKIENGLCLAEGDLNNLELPDTVQKIVLARIDRLPEAEKVTLKVAAAIGRTFQRDLLEAVHPWFDDNRSSLKEQLARLQAEDFTRQEVNESDLDFLFKHVITQEVAYETMLYSQRRQLHATIGAVLEGKYLSNDGEIVDLLAYHYSRSSERHKALFYLQRAGQKALNGYATEAAITYFSDALKVAEELDMDSLLYELYAGRERAYNRHGNRVAQTQDLDQMKKIALTQGNLNHQLEVGNRQLHLATDLGNYTQAIEIAIQTQSLAKQNQLIEWEAKILSSLGIVYWRHGNYSEALKAMKQSLQLENSFNNTQLRATNLNYLGLIYNRIAQYKQSREAYKQALEIYKAIGDKGGEAGCANNLGLFESSLGRYKNAKQHYAQALSICISIGDRLREGISLNTLGQVLTILGNYKQAENHLQNSLTIRRDIGDRRGEAFCLHDMGHLYLAQEQYQKAAQHFAFAANLRQELDEMGNYIASLAAYGEASLLADDFKNATQALKQAVEGLQQGLGNGEYPPQSVWWAYAQLCQQQGKEKTAKQALQKAYALIQTKAKQIDDPDLKHSYLTNIPVNAAITAALK